jgi:transposase
LVWDGNGFWLLYKRLEKGTFPFTFQAEGERVEIERNQLAMLLEGIEWKNLGRSSRFTLQHGITLRDGSLD